MGDPPFTHIAIASSLVMISSLVIGASRQGADVIYWEKPGQPGNQYINTHMRTMAWIEDSRRWLRCRELTDGASQHVSRVEAPS